MTRDTDRGISDVVAFVLTFSIIITAVGTVYFLGFGSIADLRNTEQINSADRTMQGVADAMADVQRENVPGRSIEIGLDEGSLITYDSTIRVTTGAGGTESIDVGALVVEPKESPTELIYEGGIAYRARNDAGAFVQHDPTFSCTNNAAVLDLVKIRGQISTSVPGALELRMERRYSKLLYPNVTAGERPQDASTVELDLSGTRRPDAWDQYFATSSGQWSETADGYECAGVDSVYVRMTVVRLETTF